MLARHGTWLIAGASLIGLALGASAQTKPAAFAAPPKTTAPAPTKPSGLENLIGLLTNAAAQTRPSTFAAAPGGSTAQSQPLPVDRAAAGRAANSPVNSRGRTVDAKAISANAAAINSIQIPVLLPGEPDLAANLRVFPNGPFYTASSKSAGMAFVLTGAGRAFPLPPGAAKGLPGGGLAGRIPPDGIVIDGSEAGISASFNRFGASYSISLECASPLADPRCTNAGYIRGVIGRLMVIMPGTAS